MKWILLTIMVAMVMVAGCGVLHKLNLTPKPLPETGTEKLMETTKSTNLLFIAGAIGLALGVAALVNGSKSAMAFIVASATLIGISLTVAKYGTALAFVCLAGGAAWFVYSLFIKKGFLTFNFMEVKK